MKSGEVSCRSAEMEPAKTREGELAWRPRASSRGWSLSGGLPTARGTGRKVGSASLRHESNFAFVDIRDFFPLLLHILIRDLSGKLGRFVIRDS